MISVRSRLVHFTKRINTYYQPEQLTVSWCSPTNINYRTLRTAPRTTHTTRASTSSATTKISTQTDSIQHESKILPLDSLPRYPTTSTLGVLRSLDYLGTTSFAMSGSLLAATSGMDILGATMVGTITAVGGGTIRDAIVLNKRPFWTEEPEYLYICLATSLLTFMTCVSYPRFIKAEEDSRISFLADALGVGAFAVIGAQNGLRAGVPSIVVGLCGMATATFGGVVRDVLCGKRVRILHSYAEIYATTAAAGAVSYMMMRKIGANVFTRVTTGVTVAVLLRTWARTQGVRLPVYNEVDSKNSIENCYQS